MTEFHQPKNLAVGVCFDNLTVRKNGRAILENITAQAPRGGATVLVGPNGAGKTTLLRCLLGEIPHAGKIHFFDSRENAIARPVIGYVPQILQADAGMPLRVYEFLALDLEKKPIWLGCAKKVRNRGRQLLELVDAEKLEEQRMGELSGGEMRRVLLASALGRKPDLLILDEAEAGVDYKGERLFWESLEKLRKEFGFSLLMVSHNLPLAAHYATHVICMNRRILAQGQPKTTLTGKNLLALFGIPIHLYPNQCGDAGPACPDCGALGAMPYLEKGRASAYHNT